MIYRIDYEIKKIILTLNSCSRKLNRLSSHDNSNAVKMGSFEDNAIKLGLANARYALILDRECRNESSNRDITHSSHPHLKFEPKKKKYDIRTRCLLLIKI